MKGSWDFIHCTRILHSLLVAALWHLLQGAVAVLVGIPQERGRRWSTIRLGALHHPGLTTQLLSP